MMVARFRTVFFIIKFMSIFPISEYMTYTKKNSSSSGEVHSTGAHFVVVAGPRGGESWTLDGAGSGCIKL